MTLQPSDFRYPTTHHGADNGAFEEDGWLLLPGFLSASETLSLRARVDDHLAATSELSCLRQPGNDLVPLRWNDRIVADVLGSSARTDRLRTALKAPDLRWISGYISRKQPHSAALWWHQDWWCWDHGASFARPAPQVALLCYLTDTGTQNGALRVLPGSHHRWTSLHAVLPPPHGTHANGLPADHPAMRDHAEQRTLGVRAGDAVVLDYRLLHGTHPNGGPHRRDCLLLSFVPGWNGLPADLKAHLIAHPALPSAEEAGARAAACYRRHLPVFDGQARDLALNRTPPAAFKVVSKDMG